VLSEAQVNDAHQRIADELKQNDSSLVFIGNQAIASPYYSLIEALAREIAKATNSQFGYLTDGANACGGWLAGCVPHRGPAGEARDGNNMDASNMLSQPRNLYLLHNVEAEYDFADPMLALSSLTSADFVVCMTPFVSSEMKTYADVMLPIAPYTENAGSYINAEGISQSFVGLPPLKESEARPAWKVIRVLSNYFDLEGFDYNSVSEVKAEFDTLLGDVSTSNDANITETATLEEKRNGIYRCSEVNMYRTDNLVRRSEPLQDTDEAKDDRVRINQSTAEKLGVSRSTQILARHEGRVVSLALEIDDSVADNSAWIPAGMLSTRKLGPMFGLLELEAD
jgi:NADH-quinone oxidoreductase subunit G